MFEPGDFITINEDWQSNCVDIKQRGNTLLQTGHYSDCKIIVGPDPNSAETFEVHKLVLAMASPVFETIFFRDETEKTILLADVKPESFRAMLKYIYSENINVNSYESARDLYYCATKYMLLQLAQVCITFMACNVNPWNACHALQMGRLCDEQSLINEAMQVVKSNIKDVLQHNSFYEVDVSTIATIFNIEDLNVENEIELFLALKQYARVKTSCLEGRKRRGSPRYGSANKKIKVLNDSSKNMNIKEEHKVLNTENRNEKKEQLIALLQPAVSAIRFLTLSSEQFVQHVARSGLLSVRDALALLANIVSKDARLPVPDGFSDQRQPRTQRPLPKPTASQTEFTSRVVVGNIDKQCMLVAETRSFELAARRWAVRLLPRREGSTATPCATSFLGLFIRCLDPAPAPWACRMLVEFRLLAARPADLPRTLRMEQIFTSVNPEWGFARFVNLTELKTDSTFVSDNRIVIDMRVKILENRL